MVAMVEIHGMLIGGSVDDRCLIIQAVEESGVAHFSLDHTSDLSLSDLNLGIKIHHIYFVHHAYDTEPEHLALIERIRTINPVSDIILIVETEDKEVFIRAQIAGCDDCLQKSHLQRNPLARLVGRAARKIAAVEEIGKLNEKFELIERAADAGSWEWDLRKNCSIWSEQQYRLFGIDPTADKVVHYHIWRSVIHPEDADRLEADLGRAIIGQAIFDTEFRIILPASAVQNGKPAVRWLRGMGLVQRDASGAAIRMTGINFDITAQKVSLSELKDEFAATSKVQKRTTSLFHTHFENSPDCMVQIGVTDNGRLIYEAINPAGLKHGGLVLDETIGKTPEEVLGPEVGGAIAHGLRTVVETRKPYYYQPSFDMATGPVIYDAVYTPVFDENGMIDSILICARDITLLRRTQATLYQAQKMDAVGQLASGIAHDFNNVLNTLYTCTQLLGTQVASGFGEELLESARKAVTLGEELSSRLVNFARPKELATEVTNINKCITRMTEILARTLGSKIRLETSLATDLWLATADCHQLEIAILNLAINARDAMPDGGLLSIATRNVGGSSGENRSDPGFVEISILDTGCGMSEEVAAKAVTAFFTTKPIGKGTGLGLSMVAETIQLMNGAIRIQSELGVGTNIVLTLPRVASFSAKH